MSSDLPIWTAREPENQAEAAEAIKVFWADENYRAEAKATYANVSSPSSHGILLAKVPNTEFWISYIADEETHTLHMFGIGSVAEYKQASWHHRSPQDPSSEVE